MEQYKSEVTLVFWSGHLGAKVNGGVTTAVKAE